MLQSTPEKWHLQQGRRRSLSDRPTWGVNIIRLLGARRGLELHGQSQVKTS